MEKLLEVLRADYPHLTFSEGSTFYWSPQTKQIFYNLKRKSLQPAQYSILHEVAHALLSHTDYSADYELLLLEIAAWEHAKGIAASYGIMIDEDYIQQCLDSYRDWLYKRSICPLCGNKSMQCDASSYYQCYNCRNRWQVAGSKFCRPYRYNKGNKKSPAIMLASDSF